MTINFKTPEIKELQPRLLVLGVGGAGGNAINEMIDNNLQGVEFTLSGEDISSGTRGVGNKSVSTEVSVSHSGGDLLFIWEANEL